MEGLPKGQLYDETNPIFNTCRGQITDDTELAMSLAYGILEGINNKEISDVKYAILNIDPIAYYYGIWFLSGPFDIGNTTQNSLEIKDIEDYLKKDIKKSMIANK